jgi:hypothetical protein
LTEKQKEAKEKKKQRDHIKQLKETALEPPKKLIAAGNRLAFQSKFSELRPQYSTIKEAFGAASTAVKEMAANETEVSFLRAAPLVNCSGVLTHVSDSKTKPRRTVLPTRPL